MSDKYVYGFSEGNKSMRELLGGKGANLAEMTSIGLPVPPGFTITTEVCNHYSANGGYPDGVDTQLEDALTALEADTGKRFGDASDPLLLSVRSGARASMPGMMDTILNLGLNDVTVEGVIATTGNARFAYDCYRRFVSMYGDVVLGCKPESDDEGDVFEERLEAMKKAKGVKYDTELTADDLKELTAEFKTAVKERTGKDFPDDPRDQLWGADQRRVRQLGQRPRRRLPAPVRHPRHVGHRGQRADHGLRQHRRGVGHGRGLHAQPRERREHVLRRVPRQRPGRGRGGRRAHAAPGQRAQGAVAGRLRRADGHPEDARARDARHAGLRVHHRARPPVHAADAQRQAHRPGGHPHRRGHGRRGPHRP